MQMGLEILGDGAPTLLAGVTDAASQRVRPMRGRHKAHLIRAWLHYASRKLRMPLTGDLRLFCTAATETTAAAAQGVGRQRETTTRRS